MGATKWLGVRPKTRIVKLRSFMDYKLRAVTYALTYAVSNENYVIYGRGQAFGRTLCNFVDNRIFFVVVEAERGGCRQFVWSPHGQATTFHLPNVAREETNRNHNLYA